MNGEQLACVGVIQSAVLEDLRSHPCANWSEGRVKSVAVYALLKAGYAILEGSNWSGKGRRISWLGGKLKGDLVPLPDMACLPGEVKNRNSPDLRVVAPLTMTFEIQVRSTFTSQSQLMSDNVVNDVRRIAHGTADVLLGAFDRTIYDALRGIKADPRGRPPRNPELFSAVLPPSSDLSDVEVTRTAAANSLGAFQCCAARVGADIGVERVFFALFRATVA